MSNAYPKEPFSIKHWAEEDRPREKFIIKGKKALSDAELLAILLRSGSRYESALSLAQRLLHAVGGDLETLARLSPNEVVKLIPGRGLGPTKSLCVLAALELANRRQEQLPNAKPQILHSRDAYREIAPFIQDLDHEEFWVLYLNAASSVIARERISQGGINSTVVDLRLIFKKAVEWQAVSIVAAHNHPSGQLRPSQHDLDLTKKMSRSGELLGIELLDHLIISQGGFYSFKEHDLL
jgi:DNA repair protein RadC